MEIQLVSSMIHWKRSNECSGRKMRETEDLESIEGEVGADQDHEVIRDLDRDPLVVDHLSRPELADQEVHHQREGHQDHLYLLDLVVAHQKEDREVEAFRSVGLDHILVVRHPEVLCHEIEIEKGIERGTEKEKEIVVEIVIVIVIVICLQDIDRLLDLHRGFKERETANEIGLDPASLVTDITITTMTLRRMTINLEIVSVIYHPGKDPYPDIHLEINSRNITSHLCCLI